MNGIASMNNKKAIAAQIMQGMDRKMHFITAIIDHSFLRTTILFREAGYQVFSQLLYNYQ